MHSDDSEDAAFEEHDTPIDELVDEILRRTNEKAGKGEGVSDVPIILRVEYGTTSLCRVEYSLLTSISHCSTLLKSHYLRHTWFQTWRKRSSSP